MSLSSSFLFQHIQSWDFPCLRSDYSDILGSAGSIHSEPNLVQNRRPTAHTGMLTTGVSRFCLPIPKYNKIGKYMVATTVACKMNIKWVCATLVRKVILYPGVISSPGFSGQHGRHRAMWFIWNTLVTVCGLDVNQDLPLHWRSHDQGPKGPCMSWNVYAHKLFVNCNLAREYLLEAAIKYNMSCQSRGPVICVQVMQTVPAVLLWTMHNVS